MHHWAKLPWLLFLINCSRGAAPQPADAAAAHEAHHPDDAGQAPGDEAHTSPPAIDAATPLEQEEKPAAPSGDAPDAAAPEAPRAGTGAAGVSGGAGTPAAGSGPVEEAAMPAAPGIQTSDEVFRDDLLRTYELSITPEDWAHLQETATEELYVPAILTVEGTALGRVGVRYKGATGTLAGCFEDGKQTCRKLSMKLKLDEYEPELRWHGLKKLNFHSSLNDKSHLHERLTYKLFRDFGVLAPRSAHARLVINGEYRGLYNLTEEVDGRFTDYRYKGAEGQGTLYKEAWPGSSRDPGYFTNAQQTNEGAPVTKIVAFAEALATAPSDQLGSVVAHWMDTDATLRYLAVHTATKHWDGPLTFYCSDTWGCNNHNYFLFESAVADRFAIVAWDTDNTFYNDTVVDRARVPEWYEAPEHCERDGEFLAPGCDRLVQGFVQLGMDKFRAVLGELLAGPYKVSALQADVDRWAAQIDESVETDPAGSGYYDWRGNVDQLKRMIAERHAASEAIRDAE